MSGYSDMLWYVILAWIGRLLDMMNLTNFTKDLEHFCCYHCGSGFSGQHLSTFCPTSVRKLLDVCHCLVCPCDLRPSFSGYSMGWSPGWGLPLWSVQVWFCSPKPWTLWCDFKVKVFADFDWGRNPSNLPKQRQKSVMFPDFSTLWLEASSRILRRCEN